MSPMAAIHSQVPFPSYTTQASGCLPLRLQLWLPLPYPSVRRVAHSDPASAAAVQCVAARRTQNLALKSSEQLMNADVTGEWMMCLTGEL